MPRRDRPRRICIAPTDVASYYSGLRAGFTALGIRTWQFCFDGYAYTRHRAAPDAFIVERWVAAVAQSPALRATTLGRCGRALLLGGLRVLACGCALMACDVFIFGFSRTFLRGWELPVLRLLGRTVICVFNGSDTRPAWMSGIFVAEGQAPDLAGIVRETQRQRSVVQWLERWSTHRVCHPLSAQLLRQPFLNHLHLGHPCAVASPGSRLPPPENLSLRLLHAPTRPVQKGSARFRALVEKLRGEGREIEFEEITGRPNHEVLAAIAACDVVLDETFSDIPLAGLGSEAASHGRPALVGGYGVEELTRFAAGTGLPMDLFVHPDDLERVLRHLVDDPAWREERGRAALLFLDQQWSPVAVAERYIKICQGVAPATWSVDPTTLRYWQGWGVTESTVGETVGQLIVACGVSCLGISHNPALENHLRGLASAATGNANVATPVR